MIHSESFLRLREQTQSNFDFAVLVCTAVPQFKHAIKEKTENDDYHLVENGHFKPSEDPYSSEKRIMPFYKPVLGANFFLSSFSFFESYIFALIDEIIAFHGGESEILEFTKERLSGILNSESSEIAQKLRKQHKGEHKARYEKYSKLLNETTWIWPTDKFSLFGIQQLIANRKKMKSADIPDLMNYLLLFTLDRRQVNEFHNIRDVRNKIAHGKKLNYDLARAIQANQFLYKLASDLDKHVVQHFFVIEKYR